MAVAYCTNVVASDSLAEMRSNVERVFASVRNEIAPNGTLPIGLWLSSRAAHELTQDADGAPRLRDWLGERGLVVQSLNAFPYQQFHSAVVKHRVYEPTWADARRLLYTTQLVDLLPQLLPPGATHASISTVPLGWRTTFTARAEGASLGLARTHLHQAALHCARVEAATGVRVHVDLEPEPGCMLDLAKDVVSYFERTLPPRGSAASGGLDHRRYIGVCHDICHAAVMFERQSDVLGAYRAAGIRVGKVQISSAPACTGASDELAVLASFAEPRYLHQTCVRTAEGVKFYEDLPAALAEAPQGEWRTHFHVPVFVERLGALATTQSEIAECLSTIAQWPAEEQPSLEVETYAWDVLPPPSPESGLVAGIARELRWAAQRVGLARGHHVPLD